MKVVTLDLDKLLKEGKLTQAEYDKLVQLSSRIISHFYYNLMLGFGVVFVSLAAINLLPGLVSIGGVGFVICFLGVALSRLFPDRLKPLATTCLFVGALTFGFGVIAESPKSPISFLAVAIVWGVVGTLARSVILISLFVYALSFCLGWHPKYIELSYFMGLQEPLGMVLLFTPFTIIMFWLEKRLPLQHRVLARAAGLNGLCLVNLGFWVGSMLGGYLGIGTEFIRTLLNTVNVRPMVGTKGLFVSPWLFAIAWTIALTVTGYWAYRHKCRWLFALVATFGAIDFYTQWFKYVNETSTTNLIAGLLGIAYALAFRALNSRMKTDG